ncbi:hypothetical protein QCM77_44030 [Bradyrhizobium sp. SSUT18]|nr:hypothetical protein [Bradyrhizobium sp. SSUT18]MDH2406758.1 hypothetical protein [Bradyrhizobium sp. SSUT18]
MNFLPLWRYQNQLIDGAIVTLELTVIAAVAGLLIGVAGAIALKGRITRSCAATSSYSATRRR